MTSVWVVARLNNKILDDIIKLQSGVYLMLSLCLQLTQNDGRWSCSIDKDMQASMTAELENALQMVAVHLYEECYLFADLRKVIFLFVILCALNFSLYSYYSCFMVNCQYKEHSQALTTLKWLWLSTLCMK